MPLIGAVNEVDWGLDAEAADKVRPRPARCRFVLPSCRTRPGLDPLEVAKMLIAMDVTTFLGLYFHAGMHLTP